MIIAALSTHRLPKKEVSTLLNFPSYWSLWFCLKLNLRREGFAVLKALPSQRWSYGSDITPSAFHTPASSALRFVPWGDSWISIESTILDKKQWPYLSFSKEGSPVCYPNQKPPNTWEIVFSISGLQMLYCKYRDSKTMTFSWLYLSYSKEIQQNCTTTTTTTEIQQKWVTLWNW